jgi:ABC-type glycerol-3-phosphate transport system substrate-binding protein
LWWGGLNNDNAGKGEEGEVPQVTSPAIPGAKAIPLPAEAKIDWKQFEGEEISIVFNVHPWHEAIEPFIPEFEALTGIKVKLVKLPTTQYMTKVPADLTAGTFAFDVYMTQYYDAPKYVLEHWTADLEPFLKDPKLTDPKWYDYEDFFPAAQDISVSGGRYFDRIAITAEVSVLIYREDIYNELGLSIPKTIDDLIENAKTISDQTKIAGITLRGGQYLWWPLYGYVASYGGGYFDKNFKPIINTPESKKGIEAYVELAKYTPRGVTSYDWDEINTAMLSGQAAMFCDSSVIYSRLIDPELSKVVGKIKMAPFPEGPDGRRPHSHYWSLSVAGNSEHKEAGWFFIQWVTSKYIMYRAGLKGVLAPRDSIWNEPKFKSQFTPDFADSIQVSLQGAIISTPHPRLFEMLDVLRAEVQEVILGQNDIDAAVEFTEEEWKKMVAQ